jgi:4-amino-4-deoxy-L-arabinose transferase-like glycosyltransferase
VPQKPFTPPRQPEQNHPSSAVGRVTAPKFIALVLLLIVAVRLLTLGAYPLGSTTEPRYAEIARKMLETGNWVTPWFDHGVPFWGKPPLSFWASAATMGVFGVNEFGARLAPFLASLGCVALFWAWPQSAPLQRTALSAHAQPQHPWTLPLGASVVFLSTFVGFIASAAVMTDMFMAVGTTLCMVAFWIAVNESGQSPTPPTPRTLWRWLFFVGLALGLLAKGPVATVITGLALAMWMVQRAVFGGSDRHANRWANCRAVCQLVWRRLPWVWGSALTAALTLPWYLLAEQRTPGFLQYFIVGEHFQRFLVSGWTGDLYGQGHAEARGLIWWFGFGGFLPWSAVAVLAWFGLRLSAPEVNATDSTAWNASTGSASSVASPALSASTDHTTPFDLGEYAYLLAWTLAPLVFFTSARNILEAYVLPGLAPFALLCTLWVVGASGRWPWLRRVWCVGLICPVIWLGWLKLSDKPELRSQRALLKLWQPDTPLVYLGTRPLSANFYSNGQAQLAESPTGIQKCLALRTPVTLAAQDSLLAKLDAKVLVGWQTLGRHDGFTLMRRAPVLASPSPEHAELASDTLVNGVSASPSEPKSVPSTESKTR